MVDRHFFERRGLGVAKGKLGIVPGEEAVRVGVVRVHVIDDTGFHRVVGWWTRHCWDLEVISSSKPAKSCFVRLEWLNE